MTALVASVTADNNVTSNSLVNLGYVWQEPTTFVLPNNKGNRVFTFSNLGLIPVTAGDAFFNGSFATADYVGVLDVTNGQQSITLQGTLQGFINGESPNPVDYYAFGLLAGQTVTVSEATNPSTPLGSEELGVFDPDGRLIFTGAANASGFVTATFTADRPGAYRIAAGLPGDLALSGNPSLLTDVNYTLSVTGVGNLAIGGIKSRGDMLTEDPGITATAGDIGAIVTNANFISSTLSSVNVDSGNLRTLEAASLGRIVTGFPNSVPNISVVGQVGLIHGRARMLANVSAGGNIQLLDSEGDMEGTYTSNASIGVVRAATLSNNFSSTLGLTVFSADANGIGNDGIIDLIDVSGDLGTLAHGGPRIETGIGGNVRFIHVGGSIFQDPNFGGGGTSTGGTQFGDGGIVHAVGEAVPVTDDSGSQIMLTPSPAQTVTNPTTGVVTTVPAGQITTYSYGIFGTGGVVLVKVISTSSLTINSSSGNFGGGQSAEIGEIDMTGAGAALTTTAVGGTPLLNANGTPVLNANGTPVLVGGVLLPANDATAVASSLNTLSIVGAIATSVFSITDPFTINRITDNTGGDIVNMTTGNVGTLTVAGNLGSTHSTTGAVLNQSAVIAGGNTYPFEQQHTGIVVGNVVSISTNNALGNIIANGGVGSITADAGGTAIKGALEGITGPIVVNGNLGTIRIGNGVASSGLAPFSATNDLRRGEFTRRYLCRRHSYQPHRKQRGYPRTDHRLRKRPDHRQHLAL